MNRQTLENKHSRYFNSFRTTPSDINKIFSKAMNKGGDYCDIFFEKREVNFINLEDNCVNKAYTGFDLGAGIRVIKGDQTGYSFTEEISADSLGRAAKTAANIADQTNNFSFPKLHSVETGNFYPVKEKWNLLPVKNKMKFLSFLNEKIFSLDKRIIKAKITYTDENRDILIVSSDGNFSVDTRPMTIISVSCTAEENGKKESNGFSVASRNDFSFLDERELERIAKESVKRTVGLFEAIQPKGGEMEIILNAGSSGILLHEAIGHGLEADFNRKGISVFTNKMGKMIADKSVSIIDDGTIKNDRGAVNVDDENIRGEKTVLVNEGKLESYLHDRLSAEYYGVAPTGSGRRGIIPISANAEDEEYLYASGTI